MSRASRWDERADCAQRMTLFVHWRLVPYETNPQRRRRIHDENAAGLSESTFAVLRRMKEDIALREEIRVAAILTGGARNEDAMTVLMADAQARWLVPKRVRTEAEARAERRASR